MNKVIDELYNVIKGRKGADAETSYTASLFKKGKSKIAKKVGEESAETIIAYLTEGKERIISESADLLYHLLVLLADSEIEPEEIYAELKKREGTSGIEEKRNRKKE